MGKKAQVLLVGASTDNSARTLAIIFVSIYSFIIFNLEEIPHHLDECSYHDFNKHKNYMVPKSTVPLGLSHE